MATVKKNVKALNEESPTFRRLAAKGLLGLGDLLDSLLENARAQRVDSLNYVESAAAVAIATTTSKAKTVNTVNYTVGGVQKSKAATDNLWTLSGGGVVPISSFQKYALCLDASGAASVVAGTPAATAAAVKMPFLSDPLYNGITTIAILVVATNGATTFTPGTTLLGAAGITSTFTDGADSAQFPAAPSSLV